MLGYSTLCTTVQSNMHLKLSSAFQCIIYTVHLNTHINNQCNTLYIYICAILYIFYSVIFVIFKTLILIPFMGVMFVSVLVALGESVVLSHYISL